jgi:hypothetical protein
MSTPSKEQRAAWHADPANWRWGVFYYTHLRSHKALGYRPPMLIQA